MEPQQTNTYKGSVVVPPQITIEKSRNLYRRYAKNKVQKAHAWRISRLFGGVLVSALLA